MNYLLSVFSGSWKMWFGWLAITLALVGCSGREKQRNPTEERLYKIGKAYMQANHRLGRAPKDFEEIKPDIEGGITEDMLRSPNDGENFVILWGVDHAKLLPAASDPYTIGGYEKNGVDGSRYVLRFPLSVKVLNQEAFRKAVFPPGHEPPSN